MNILVTGYAGFIGSHLDAHLREKFPEANVYGLSKRELKGAIKCDLEDEDAVANAIEKIRPDQVYHLAGASRVSETGTFEEYFKSNFLATCSLIHAIERIQQPVDFFFSSSVHVYGNPTEEVSETSRSRPINVYGYSKYLAEEALRRASRDIPNFRVVVGRLYSCIGPGQATGFAVSDFCRKIVTAEQQSSSSIQTGPLDALRRFLDVRDTVQIFPKLLDQKDSAFEIYNVASPHEYQIKEILSILVSLSPSEIDVDTQAELNPNRFQGVRTSVDKLLGKLPNIRFRPIEETLSDMLSHMRTAPTSALTH